MRRNSIQSILFGGLAASLLACSAPANTISPEQANVTITKITDGLENPWGLAFLPDGRMLVTERAGKIRYVSADGKKSPPISGLPKILVRGQGGLFDVILDPQFSSNKRIYFSFNEPAEEGSSTAVAQATLSETALTDVKVIFRQQPKFDSPQHFGGRLVFTPDGELFLTLGDRGRRRQDAQTLDTHHGKIVRLQPDGSTPADNPFVTQKDALGEIWSYGHRNIQGATLHPQTGELWTHEHGPQGGDEINIARAGKNYGWPLATYGEEYGGGKIGTTSKPGMEPPLHYWVPSIAPSGMTFYAGSAFPEWKNNLLVGSLKFDLLVRLTLDGEKVTHEERIDIGQRVRDVRQGPDGAVYLLTDESDGELLRLTPAQSR